MIALLLDHLWQSSIFTGAVALLILALRRNGADVRFWLWFAASMKFLVPFAAVTALGVFFLPPIVAPVAAPTVKMALPIAKPFSVPALTIGLTPIPPSPVAPTLAVTVPTPSMSHLDLGMVLLVIWALGFLFLALRWHFRWSRVRAALRDASDMPVDAPIAVKFSASRLEPGLVGILRPVILLPQGIEQQLSPAELKAVLAHELCHWRRNDNLLATLHMLVEALFWFFPLIWWLGARLNAERERACDESVLAQGNAPELYAEGILKVCRAYLQSPLACVAGVSGAGLKQRIDAIMENGLSRRLNGMRKLLLGAFASATLIVPLVLGLVVAPMAHVPALAKTALFAKLNIHEPAAISAPPAEPASREPSILASQPSPSEEQAPVHIPEARHVTLREIPDAILGPVQVAMNSLPVLSGSASADEPKTRFVCLNNKVTGRVISPAAIMMPGFACDLGGEQFPRNARLFGSCPLHEDADLPRIRTGTRVMAPSSSCKFNVNMNVQLADPADAARMQPGMTVQLSGDFRVASQNHIDYLIVSNARIIFITPSVPVPGEKVSSFTCQPLQLIELSRQVGQTLCVQDEIIAALSAEGSALSTAAHSFTRHPIRNTPVGAPDEITCRLGSQTQTRLQPPLNCARNSYWISRPSQSYGFSDMGTFNQPGNGSGGDGGATQPGYVSGGIP